MQDATDVCRLEVRNETAELDRVIATLDALWLRHGIDGSLQADLNIAVEEALSNAIRHGGSTQSIQMHVEVDPESVRIEIQDSGIPFNPLTSPAPDPGMTLDQRRPGGLGIFMLLHLMDRTEYQRAGGNNILTMVKNRRPL